MKRTLTQVTVDCLLAFYLNSADQADAVLVANLDKVSEKNKRVLQQVLERSQAQRRTYWLAIADEIERQALADDLNVDVLKPKTLAIAMPLATHLTKPLLMGV